MTSLLEEPIRITQQLPPAGRDQVACIFCQAFGPKLRRLVLFTQDMQQTMAVCRNSLDYGQAFYAVRDQRVIGFVGLEEGRRRFVTFNRQALQAAFGFWGGLWRWLILKTGTSLRHPRARLRVDALAVAEGARRQGIGTRLLQAVIDHGRAHGYRYVDLEVVDTNKGAIKLYKRLGFAPRFRIPWGPLTRHAGFGAEIRMRRNL